jgi:5-methylcytosine-specific restriction endonuclease McrA
MVKACKHCLLELPLEQFYPHKRAADGHESICKKCSKVKTYAYRAANRKKVAAYQQRYKRRQAGLETPVRVQTEEEARASRLAAGKRYALAHPELDRMRKKRWRRENSAAVNEYQRVYMVKWRAENRERDNLLKARYRHARRAAGELPPVDTLLALLKRPCAYCSGLAVEIDHVIPVSKGGSNALENLAPACRGCNASKRNRTPEEWRETG